MYILRGTFFLLWLCSVQAFAVGQWPDSDNDGVPDHKDACPGTSAGMIVMANGCQDPDSVASNSADMMRATASLQQAIEQCQKQVDELICINALLTPVYFDTGSYQILPTQVPSIKRLSEVLSAVKHGQLTLIGHTDNIGTDSDNTQLSVARAEAVKGHLVSNHTFYNSMVMNAVGKGSKQPVSTNDSKEGRQRNRRVEFHISAE